MKIIFFYNSPTSKQSKTTSFNHIFIYPKKKKYPTLQPSTSNNESWFRGLNNNMLSSLPFQVDFCGVFESFFSPNSFFTFHQPWLNSHSQFWDFYFFIFIMINGKWVYYDDDSNRIRDLVFINFFLLFFFLFLGLSLLQCDCRLEMKAD